MNDCHSYNVKDAYKRLKVCFFVKKFTFTIHNLIKDLTFALYWLLWYYGMKLYAQQFIIRQVFHLNKLEYLKQKLLRSTEKSFFQ